LELKLLVSELNILPKDQEAASAPVNLAAAAGQPAPTRSTPSAAPPAPASPAAAPSGQKVPVAVAVDKLARPGAMVSGGVTFSDGHQAAWYVDEMGRLSVAAGEPGYRPTAGDMQEFQMALEQELARAGF
jgi:hypothetical protein